MDVDLPPNVPKVFEVKFSEAPINLVKVEPASNYSWTVKLTNSGKIRWPKTVFVYKISKKMAEITSI